MKNTVKLWVDSEVNPTQEIIDYLVSKSAPVGFRIYNTETNKVSIFIIDEDGNRFDLEGGSKDGIPLTGTEAGKPVTGLIGFTTPEDVDYPPICSIGLLPWDVNEIGMFSNRDDGFQIGVSTRAFYVTRTELGQPVETDMIEINGNYGFASQNIKFWETPNFDELCFTQKGYVDLKIPYTGTEQDKTITGNLVFENAGLEFKDPFNDNRKLVYINEGENFDGASILALWFADNEYTGLTNGGIIYKGPDSPYRRASFLYQYDEAQSGFIAYVPAQNLPTFRGLGCFYDVSSNIQDFDYTQKIYVDNPQTLINTLNNATSAQLDEIRSILGI